MYETDQEQIEAIKGWWSQNGNWVIGGFIVFILAYVGYLWYQSSAENHRFDASATYDELMLNLNSESPDPEKRKALVETLKTDYADLGYGAMAALIEAKAAVDEKDYSTALKELNWAESHGEKSLMPVILYRKAQVQYAQDELDAAISTLNSISGNGHQAVSMELKGDILLAQGKRDEARTAYQDALDRAGDESVNNPYLQIKLDDLSIVE